MKTKNFVLFIAVALLALFGFAGCYEPVSPPEIVSEPGLLPIERAVQRRIVGSSAENRPIECLVFGQGHDVTFILATIHGDEPAGTPIVRRLAEHLQQNPQLLQGRRVVLMPVANPDGMAIGSRCNAHGVDLNRNFNAANRINSREFGLRALSEPEARAIRAVIREYLPDRIVSIHQRMHNQPACIDYDGPAQMLARQMASHCPLPVHRLGAKPGSLGSYAGLTLQIPTITFELPSSADRLDRETLWQRYGAALIAAIVYPENFE